MFLTSWCKSSSLTVLVDRVYDPVDTRIISDCDVRRIDKYNFEVFICSILVDPVGVQHSQIHASSSCAFLCNTSQISCELQLVDTLVLRLTVHNTLSIGSFASTSAYSNT